MSAETFLALMVGGGVFTLVGLSGHMAIYFGLLKERYGTRAEMVAAYKRDAATQNAFVFGTFKKAHGILFMLCYGGWALGLGMLAAGALLPVSG